MKSTGVIQKLVRLSPPAEAPGMGGYGIIRGVDGREVFFVHSAVQGVSIDELHTGQQVCFEMPDGPLSSASVVSLPNSSDESPPIKKGRRRAAAGSQV